MRLAFFELKLYVPRYRTRKLQKSFKYQGAKFGTRYHLNLKKLPFDQFKIQKIFIVKLQMIHNSKLIKIDKSSSLIYSQRIQINMKN